MRLSGIYWGLTCLALLDDDYARLLDRDAVIEFVQKCQRLRGDSDGDLDGAGDPDAGGFGGHPGMDAHLLYTLSAVQVLAIYDRLDAIDQDAVVKCASSVCQWIFTWLIIVRT